MDKKENQALCMSIDMKKYRIRFHKTTLRSLGNPSYVQLLLSPRHDAIVLLRQERQVHNGQEIRVSFDHIGSNGTFDVYSKELVERIRAHFPGLEKTALYRLTGYVLQDECGVCFPLNTLSLQEAHNAQAADR